jgi:hypothetical protein
MDERTFISQIIASIIWPVTTVILVLLLRQPIGMVLIHLRRLKFKDIELEFRKVGALLESTPSPPAATAAQVQVVAADLQSTQYDEIIKRSPKEAMLTAWHDTEKAALLLLDKKVARPDRTRPVPPGAVAQLLRSMNAISEHYYQALLQLAHIRNRVVHEADLVFDERQAVLYCSLAVDFITYAKTV